jgi:Spy/CpxP family protein refolding chaperone
VLTKAHPAQNTIFRENIIHGPGMMGGYGARPDLDLNAAQRSKVARIRDDVRRRQWELMGKMHDEQSQMNDQYASDARDDAALSKSYQNLSELRHQMFDLSLSAQKADGCGASRGAARKT